MIKTKGVGCVGEEMLLEDVMQAIFCISDAQRGQEDEFQECSRMKGND